MKTVVLTAFQFPPLVGTSGVQRTLRFVQHLPAFGWRPVVLTVHRGIHRNIDRTTEDALPPQCHVVRAPCLDTSRHLAIGGRYLSALALPDRWTSWRWFAPFKLGEILQGGRPSVVWSTYPIATAHHVGQALAQRLGVPWVADFRDPMAQDGYPADPLRHRAFVKTEKLAMARARKLVFVAPSALAMYRERYPEVPAERFELIENGYDEAAFDGLDATAPPPPAGRPLVLLHSGIVYPQERDPVPLFEALGRLRRAGTLTADDLVLRFRAPVHADLIRDTAREQGVADCIEILPQVSYGEALAEMMAVDALLVLQSRSCNEQIPAKAYEYLRTGRPIVALTDPSGDTGRLLETMQARWVAPLESADAIAALLPEVVAGLRRGEAPVVPRDAVARYSRRALTQRLAALLDDITDST